MTNHLDLDIEGEFSQLAHPILIVWGQEATLTPITDVEPFLTVNPQARLQVFGESRLLPHVERSEGFNAAVLAFLGGTPQPEEASVAPLTAAGLAPLDDAATTAGSDRSGRA